MRTPLALLILILGCGCWGSSAGDDPVHMHVVCPAGADGGTVACNDSERLLAFDTWVGEALSRPHSSFTIWAVGPDRQHYRPHFTLCVPPSWGPGVMEAKARFIRAAREGAGGGQTESDVGATLPQGRFPPGSLTLGIHRLEVSAAVSPSAMRPGVWQAVAKNSTARSPLHMAVVCDRSNSTLGVACTPEGLLGAFDLWIADGLAAAGSSWSVYVAGSSRDTVRLLYTLSVPERSVGERVALLLSARRELAQLLSGTLEENSSALVEAIHLAMGEIGERKGRYWLVVLSDLRQFTPGRWNFERSVPSPQRFASWWRTERLSVDLRDIPVTACGLHNRRGPGARPYDARIAVQTRDAWDGAFRAMGATEIGMFSTCEAAFASRYPSQLWDIKPHNSNPHHDYVDLVGSTLESLEAVVETPAGRDR